MFWQEDARGWPVEFHDNSLFAFTKQCPADEHYFWIGPTKLAPLDRRKPGIHVVEYRRL